MIIGIDARFFGSIGKGLGRYTQKLIENLEQIDTQNQYVVFLRKENFAEYQPKNKNFQKVLADFQWYSFAEQFFFPKLLYKYKLDLMHFPHFNAPLLYRKKFVLTIHDLILIHFPTVRNSTLSPIFYWFKFLAYKIVIWSAINRSQKIIAVSEFTKKDILNVYKNIAKNKIEVTYEACDNFHSADQNNAGEILQKYGIIKPYLIYIGNVYPHKNPERLVLAFKELEKVQKDIKLVFVGGEDYFYARLKKFVEEKEIKNIIFSGFVSDDELGTFLCSAEAYVRPSLYEGFELPPLEAMTMGVPVLSSNHECASEILGDSALYFDGKNIDDMTNSILKITTDKELRKKLIEKGYEQIKKYSWEKMARETLVIYSNVESKK
jgi:glycosyltransferase involved in cell wall biosynthesis